MNNLLWLAPAALAWTIGGCAPVPGRLSDAPMPAAQTAQSCTAQGGFLERRGRMGMEICVHPYNDAGKSCSADADCQGRCIAQTDADGALPETGQPAGGMCQRDDALFGCYAEVEGGIVKTGICKD